MKEFWLAIMAMLLGSVFFNWAFSLSEAADILVDLAFIVIE